MSAQDSAQTKVGQTYLGEFEQFVVRLNHEDQTIVLHEADCLPGEMPIRVDA